MRKNHMSRGEKILVTCVILAFAVMMTLMVMTIAMNSSASGTLYSEPPFALSSLTSDADSEGAVSTGGDYVFPACIGIAPFPEGLGISVGDNVVRELYTLLSPCLADGLMTKPVEDTAETWEAALHSDRVVYIRYHSALPVLVLQGTAAVLCGGTEDIAEPSVQPVRELLILLPDTQNSDCQILLRDAEETIWRYLCSGRREYPDLAGITAFVQGFPDSFFRFTLGAEGCGDTEPVFLERLRVRNMILTTGTIVMIQENQVSHFKKLLRQFDFNPDKLSTHEEADGTQVTVESHGLFRVQADRLTYTAGADGGILLENFVGYKEAYTPMDCLRAACTMIENLRSMHYYYLAGDGDVLLTEMSMTDGQLRMVFRYTFDNLLLEGCDPALVVLVENNRVMLADMYAVVLRSIGDFNSSFMETGVLHRGREEGVVYSDVTLTYPVDFQNNSIYPVWTLYREND